MNRVLKSMYIHIFCGQVQVGKCFVRGIHREIRRCPNVCHHHIHHQSSIISIISILARFGGYMFINCLHLTKQSTCSLASRISLLVVTPCPRNRAPRCEGQAGQPWDKTTETETSGWPLTKLCTDGRWAMTKPWLFAVYWGLHYPVTVYRDCNKPI